MYPWKRLHVLITVWSPMSFITPQRYSRDVRSLRHQGYTAETPAKQQLPPQAWTPCIIDSGTQCSKRLQTMSQKPPNDAPKVSG